MANTLISTPISGTVAAPPSYGEWSILEVLGHRRLGGYVCEEKIAGVGMVRIDVPATETTPAYTQYYGASSIFCLTPTTEEQARAVAAHSDYAPVSRWETPAPQPTMLLSELASAANDNLPFTDADEPDVDDEPDPEIEW